MGRNTVRNLACAVVLLWTGLAFAQGSVRGQVFLPNGQAIGAVVELRLQSDDYTRQMEIYYTDSQGRYYIAGLSTRRWYTLTIPGDGKSFDTTAVNFSPGMQPSLAIHLRPVEGFRIVPKSNTVTTEELREPSPRAKALHDDAMLLIRKNQFSEARAKLQKAIDTDPGFTAPYNDLGVLFIGDRRYAEAEAVLRAGLKKNPESFHALYNLGVALNYLGRHEEAKAPLRAALKKRPGWTSAETQLGIALLETDMLDAARPCLERGVQAEGQDQTFAYLYLGKLHAQQGTYADAVYAWQQYLKLDSSSANAAKIRGLLEQIRPQAVGQTFAIKATGACE